MSNASATDTRVHRIQIHPTEHAGDPRASEFVHRAELLGTTIERATSARIFLVEGEFSEDQLDSIVTQLLCNPVVETVTHGSTEPNPDATLVEVHPLPGVMDPPAQSTAAAIKALTGIDAMVSTGYRYEIFGLSDDDARSIAQRVLANPIVSAVHAVPYFPEELPKGHDHEFNLTHVAIRDLEDDELETLSRDGHLFLDLHEMQAIRHEYQQLGREPTDIELETLAQTWSEHCVHKTLKATIHYAGPSIEGIDWSSRPHHEVHEDGSVTINNLLKATVAAATFELIEEGLDWTQSVFVDNAGIVRFDDDHSVCIKVETHNHPSALEPYGGAATGIGGCIRDIVGTGLAAKPIASTDVFCVANPETTNIPDGCLHPKRILSEVVGGVRDYGNRMGIPTINGAVSFDDRYIGNPLVYCGCIGIMPNDLISGDAQQSDRIIALGGRTGRDGIHGATFSSAELTDSHADEFSHAVQIGNAIEEKRTLDAILRARDNEGGPLYTAITDCGAGGFSSAVGEMGEKIGADVHLDRAPLKYNGLTYDEIWISEAQERMVLAVPEKNLTKLRSICEQEHVEMADLGHFGTPGAELVLNFHGTEVGRLPMEFLHDGASSKRTTTRTPERKRGYL
jgi:phosphoribosylformylglycinamidine (FGAM) synthase-like enzyme/phosphoribosylformylglycinamidine (FGAM) synthase PurS component